MTWNGTPLVTIIDPERPPQTLRMEIDDSNRNSAAPVRAALMRTSNTHSTSTVGTPQSKRLSAHKQISRASKIDLSSLPPASSSSRNACVAEVSKPDIPYILNRVRQPYPVSSNTVPKNPFLPYIEYESYDFTDGHREPSVLPIFASKMATKNPYIGGKEDAVEGLPNRMHQLEVNKSNLPPALDPRKGRVPVKPTIAHSVAKETQKADDDDADFPITIQEQALRVSRIKSSCAPPGPVNEISIELGDINRKEISRNPSPTPPHLQAFDAEVQQQKVPKKMSPWRRWRTQILGVCLFVGCSGLVITVYFTAGADY
jgi:hypothetical protein